jgi:hypothetical protein
MTNYGDPRDGHSVGSGGLGTDHGNAGITVAVVVVTYNSALLLDDLCTSLKDGLKGSRAPDRG